jgi:hypothetical protein
MLKEFENRFVRDPLMEMSRRRLAKKKKSKRNDYVDLATNFNHDATYSNHTISSAIKADYSQPNVKTKLNELNASVKRTRVIRTAPGIESTLKTTEQKPFVVRKAEEQLISRKPELHDVMHDGLVLLRKNLKKATQKFKKSKRASSRSLSPRCLSSGSARRVWLDEPLYKSPSQVYENKYLNDTTLLNSANFRPTRSSNRVADSYEARSRLSRSLSPRQFSKSLNENLVRESWPRPRSSSASRSPARRTQDSAYGTLTNFYGGKYLTII